MWYQNDIMTWECFSHDWTYVRGKPLVSSGFPSQRANNAELWCFLFRLPGQAVEQMGGQWIKVCTFITRFIMFLTFKVSLTANYCPHVPQPITCYFSTSRLIPYTWYMGKMDRLLYHVCTQLTFREYSMTQTAPRRRVGQAWVNKNKILIILWGGRNKYQLPHSIKGLIIVSWSHIQFIATYVQLVVNILRDHFVHAPSQWETMLHCSVVSDWPSACKMIPDSETRAHVL